MGFNMIGFSEATPGANGNVACPVDPMVKRLSGGDGISIKEGNNYLIGIMYAAEATGERLVVQQIGGNDFCVMRCVLTADLDQMQGYTHLFETPIWLKPGELRVQSINAADEDTIVGLMIGNGALKPRGQIITDVLQGIGDTTIATANVWQDVALSWNTDLDRGTYKLLGMRAGVWLAANPWTTLARIVIPGDSRWRPGVPANIMEADHEEYQSVTHEPCAIWGDIGIEFDAPDEIPETLQVLSPSLITDENVELYLRKV